MIVFNIFCDASVGPKSIGSCAGALVEYFYVNENGKKYMPRERSKNFYALIQPDGTNNRGEIAAICLGTIKGLELYTQYVKYRNESIRINVFSDSLISIRGIREWMPTWIKKMTPDGILMSSSGKPVKNQWYFKYIYNLILLNPGFKIHYYHQDGHVTSDFNSVIPRFEEFNPGVTLSGISMSPSYICLNNDIVDNETRRIINEYLINKDTNGYPVEMSVSDIQPLFNDDYRLIDHSDEAIMRYLDAIS